VSPRAGQPGRVERRSHDDPGDGTTTLVAGVNSRRGKVISEFQRWFAAVTEKEFTVSSNLQLGQGVCQGSSFAEPDQAYEVADG